MTTRTREHIYCTLVGFAFGFVVAGFIIPWSIPLTGVTTMKKWGENRGEATMRIEKELNDRWGKGPFLVYEIHIRHPFILHPELNDEWKGYDTYRWTEKSSMQFRVKRTY